jgi:hypothetical protein
VSHLLEIVGFERFEKGRHVLEDPKLADFLGEGQSVVGGVGFDHNGVFWLVYGKKDVAPQRIYHAE